MTYTYAIKELLKKAGDELIYPVNICINSFSANYIQFELDDGLKINEILNNKMENTNDISIQWLDNQNKINSISLYDYGITKFSNSNDELTKKSFNNEQHIKIDENGKYRLLLYPLEEKIEIEENGFVKQKILDFDKHTYQLEHIPVPKFDDYRYQSLYIYDSEEAFINAILLQFIIRQINHNNLAPDKIEISLKKEENITEEELDFIELIEYQKIENEINIKLKNITNKLYIPDIKKSILIVDGQHRVAGLSLLDQEIQKKLSLPINLVVGQINSVLSSMFYTINSTQKPVNPSVLEYMTNLFLEDLSESKLFQEYIRLLNDNSKSPLYGEIKMFGVGQGLISFSPLHKSLMNLTEEVTSRSKNIPIFRALFKDEENRYIILNLIIFYFKSIKKLFYTTEWPKDNPFIKTTGLMILLYVFPRILLKILDTKYDLTSYKKLELITEDDLFESIKKLLLIDIEPFKKGSSMGMAKVLRDKVLLTLNIENYDEKFADKISWIKKFREKK